MKKSYHTYTPNGNRAMVYRKRRRETRKIVLGVAAGAVACIIAARITIPAMCEARGGFYIGGEFPFCATVGILVGKAVGKIYGLKTRG